MYSFNQIVKGGYKTWTINLVMEYSIGFIIPKRSTMDISKNKYHISEKWFM